MDALLSMLDLDELREALDAVEAWVESGDLPPDEAQHWRDRIQAWARSGDQAT